MNLKHILSVIVTGALILSVSTVSASAENSCRAIGIVSPMYEIAKDPRSSLNLSGNTAYCSCYATGIDIVSVTATQTLEKYQSGWDAVPDASWTSTANSGSITFSNTKSGLDSGTYHLKTVFTFTDKNGKTETVTVYSSEKTVT